MLLESNTEQEKVKENLNADVAEKIPKSVFWKNHKFKWKIASLLRRVVSQKWEFVDLLLRKGCISNINTSVFQI